MESRSGSIKDPMYYPENDGVTSIGEPDKSHTSSLGSQEINLDDNNALKVPRKFIANWRQACDRTRDRTKDLLKKWRTTASNVDEQPGSSTAELEQANWSVHVWSE